MRTKPRRTLAALATATALLVVPAGAGAVEINDPKPEGFTNATTATFSLTADPAFPALSCVLDGGAAQDCSSGTITYSGLADGLHRLDVTAGADPMPSEHEWTVDTAAPDTTLTAQPPANSNSSSATFQFTSTDAGTFQCSLDGAAPTPCTSPVTYNALPNGNHTFSVFAVDQAMNQDASPATASWAVAVPIIADDSRLAPPPAETTITSGPSGLNNIVQPRIEFTSSPPDRTFQCSINGGPFAACSSPMILAGLVDGAISFQVRAFGDLSPASLSWTRDTVAPAAPAVSIGPRTGAFQTTTKALARWKQVQDAASYDSEAALVPAGSAPTKGTWKALQSNGTATQAGATVRAGATGCFRVRSTDAAGNDSAFAAIRCTSVPYKTSSSAVTRTKGYLRLNLPTAAVVKRVALLATKCKRCGKVRVVVTGDGSPPISASAASKTVSLTASKTRKAQLISVTTFPSAAATSARRYVYVFPVGKAKLSRIEGIGVSPV